MVTLLVDPLNMRNGSMPSQDHNTKFSLLIAMLLAHSTHMVRTCAACKRPAGSHDASRRHTRITHPWAR